MAELPRGLWPELIGKVVTNVTTPGSTEIMKESSLSTIGL